MRKVLAVCLKDLQVLLADPAALVLMFLAPFVLTLGMGLLSGSGGSNGRAAVPAIPVVLVNLDGEDSAMLVRILTGDEDIASILTVEPIDGADLARKCVDEDRAVAAVIIPEGFFASLPASVAGGPSVASDNSGRPPAVLVYGDPGRPMGVKIVESVLDSLISRIEAGVLRVDVAMRTLIGEGLLRPDEVEPRLPEMIERSMSSQAEFGGIRFAVGTAEGGGFNFFSYFGPALAVFFLMYTAGQGGRGLLIERDRGTLARMQGSPSRSAVILSGKLAGMLLACIIQLGILVLASKLLFGAHWGQGPGVILVILAVSAAACGWGLVFASLAKTPAQVTSVSSALMLIFGILGGTFVPLTGAAPILQIISRITPNAWANEAFLVLGRGARLSDVANELIALVVMALVLFAAASIILKIRRPLET